MSNIYPLISVIVPTYNRADLILETVDSILGQTYHNIEVIIVSDGGTDSTPEVLSSICDERLQFIMLQKNNGRPAVPRNVGLRKAKGKYIAFCDDDDVWYPQKLEQQVKILTNNSDILLTCSNAITFPDEHPRVCVSKWKNQTISYDYAINNSNLVVNSTVLFRKEIIEIIGYIDEDPVLKAVEDYDYWLRLLKYKNHSIFFDVRSTIKYRVFHNKIMDRADRELKTVNRLKKVLEKHLPLSEKRLSLLKSARLKEARFNPVKQLLVKILTTYVTFISN